MHKYGFDMSKCHHAWYSSTPSTLKGAAPMFTLHSDQTTGWLLQLVLRGASPLCKCLFYWSHKRQLSCQSSLGCHSTISSDHFVPKSSSSWSGPLHQQSNEHSIKHIFASLPQAMNQKNWMLNTWPHTSLSL